MECIVCGKEFGLWARMTGDSDDAVCRACEKEGRERLEQFIGTVGPDADLANLKKAFDAEAQRYRIPPDVLASLRTRFSLNLIVAAADAAWP